MYNKYWRFFRVLAILPAVAPVHFSGNCTAAPELGTPQKMKTNDNASRTEWAGRIEGVLSSCGARVLNVETLQLLRKGLELPLAIGGKSAIGGIPLNVVECRTYGPGWELFLDEKPARAVARFIHVVGGDNCEIEAVVWLPAKEQGAGSIEIKISPMCIQSELKGARVRVHP